MRSDDRPRRRVPPHMEAQVRAEVLEQVLDRVIDSVGETGETNASMISRSMLQELPQPGRVVWYQTDDEYGTFLPAMITVTADSHPGGKNNPLPGLSSSTHAHLRVITPGEPRGRSVESYAVHDVAFDPSGSPKTWRWPR